MKSVKESWAESSTGKRGNQMAAGPQLSPQDPLLAAIIKEPDNDEPRKEFATQLPQSDPRREFILDQLTVARLNFDFDIPECRTAYSSSQWSLREHYHEWRPVWSAWIQSKVSYYEFNRGFVELIRLPADAFLHSAEDLLTAAPIRHLDLVESKGMWERLAQFHFLAGIQSIRLDDSNLTDEDIGFLAKSPYLKQLRWLNLTNNRSITRQGVEAMAAQAGTTLSNLSYVSLAGAAFNPVEDYAADGETITWQSLPESGRELENKYGYLPWLHMSAAHTSDIVPDRFQSHALHTLK